MNPDPNLQVLKTILGTIRANDPSYGADDADYEARNHMIKMALGFATALGYPTGFRADAGEPGWMIVYIELPTGQVTWHLPEYEAAWDGHTTEEKYQRINQFTQGGSE